VQHHEAPRASQVVERTVLSKHMSNLEAQSQVLRCSGLEIIILPFLTKVNT
jgi:hypothetical protein